MSTVIISLVVALLLFLAGRKLWKDKRAGKSLCGGKCSGCLNCCSCHKESTKRTSLKTVYSKIEE